MIHQLQHLRLELQILPRSFQSRKNLIPQSLCLGYQRLVFFVEDEKHPAELINCTSETNANDVKDLIDFSDTHLLDMGNLGRYSLLVIASWIILTLSIVSVIGKDIPSISFFPYSNGPKKSGIEIFQEERKREERSKSRLVHM